jgi:transcriptional regulator with XRE-family HTH domain
MNSRPRNIVGPQVRRLRSEANLSQPALAAKCQRLGWDVGRDAIAKIEGQSRWVADMELIYLARAFNCPLMDLLPPKVRASLG